MKKRVPELTHSQYAIHAVDALFNKPLFRVVNFAKSANIPIASARRIVKILEDEGILRELFEGKGRTPKLLMFSELLNIADAR